MSISNSGSNPLQNFITDTQLKRFGISDKIEKSVVQKSNDTIALKLSMRVGDTLHTVAILGKGDAQVQQAEIIAKLNHLSTLLAQNNMTWEKMIKNPKSLKTIRAQYERSAETAPSQNTGALKKMKNKTKSLLFSLKRSGSSVLTSVSSQGKSEGKKTSGSNRASSAALITIQKENLSKFKEQLSNQISADTDKLNSLKESLANATDAQDREDISRSIASLEPNLAKLERIFEHIGNEKGGMAVYTKLSESVSTEMLNDASSVIDVSLAQSNRALERFNQTADTLIKKTTTEGSEKQRSLSALSDRISEECRQNIDGTKVKNEQKMLWGLTSKWDGNSLDSIQTPTTIDIVNKVTSQLRLNTGELMPSFIENFHKEILLKDKLGTHLENGLQRQGLTDFTPDQVKANLAYFNSIAKSPEDAQRLNESYSSLVDAYKGRAANPQKYMDTALAFLDTWDEAI